GLTQHDRIDIPITSLTTKRTIPPLLPAERQEFRLTALAQQQLLNFLSPSAVLIDRAWQIRYICGEIDDFLTHTPGIPTDDLLSKCRQGLRTKLRGAVHAAMEQNKTVTFATRIRRTGTFHPIKVIVHPLKDRENDQ